MSNALTIQEMDNYANAIVKSGFCGFTKAEEVITLALIAQDEGRSIGSVARDYHIIKGRPTLKADSMLARYQSAGGKVKWLELSDRRCAAEFSHESSGTFSLEWTIDMATKAGLTNNPTWGKYPRAMLRARVISEGIRTSLPAVLCGVYTPEEAEDIAAEEQAKKPIVKKAPTAEKSSAVEKKSEVIEAQVVESKPAKKDMTAEEITAAFLKAMHDLEFEYGAENVKKALTEAKYESFEKIPADQRKYVYTALKAALNAQKEAHNG